MVGREGVTPIAAILGADTTPNDVFVQIDDDSARVIAVPVLRDLMRARQSLREVLVRYAMAFLVQTTSTVLSATNASVEQRLARWLLMCHDRVPGDNVAITHDLIATMLGTRRASITVALHVLEGMGAIRSTRGLVTVTDRARLLDLAGEAYGEAEAEYRKLIGPFPAD